MRAGKRWSPYAKAERSRPTIAPTARASSFCCVPQIDDGSWIVETRSVPIQAYFESGFPYGVNQWISAAATGWATTALALATETPQTIPASSRAGARSAATRGWERGARRLFAHSDVAGADARAASASTAAFEVETVAEGLSGAFCFDFLPDGRMIVGERPGRIRIVSKNGKLSEPLDGMPADLWAHGQGLFEVRPDRAFAANRTDLLSPTPCCPPGRIRSALPRSPGVLMVASATLSPDERRLENLKVLLNAEGTGGRLIQAPDGTLLITSTIPSGVGINAVDWPQPQQLTSNMGKVLRINADGSIPKDNPFAGRGDAHPEIYALRHPATCRASRFIRAPVLLWLSEHGPRGGDEINAIAKRQELRVPGDRLRPRIHRQADQRRQDGAGRHGAAGLLLDAGHRASGHRASTPARCFPRGEATCSCRRSQARRSSASSSKDDRVIAEERLLTELGARIRGVSQGPDGALYVLIDGNAERSSGSCLKK